MSETLKSISFKNTILSKLHLNEIDRNPICPVDRKFTTQMNKISRTSTISIGEQITSMKSIKPYKTEKLIELQPQDYSISKIVSSQAYKKLQLKFAQMMNTHKKQKFGLKREIKELQKGIRLQQQKALKIVDKFVEISRSYEQTESDYYEIKRKNYALRCQLSHKREIENQINWGDQLEYPVDGIDLDQLSYQEILEMEERMGKENTGLNKEMMKNLKQTQFKQLDQLIVAQKDMLCCICCDNIQLQHIIIQLDCGHIHHSQCIRKWLHIQKFCPLCKTQVQITSSS